MSGGSKGQHVYRGVHAAHPARFAALTGVAVPGNIYGTVTADAHNLLGLSADSPFTSWTHDLDIARRYANSAGRGGIILRLPVGPAGAGAAWSWVWSPDVYGEAEVLLRGIRSGAEVLAP